ncbi:MAG TPA: MFS transporter [Myxococcota bacterium]
MAGGVDTAAPAAADDNAVIDPALARQRRRIMGVVFLTLFLDLLGFGIILPVQPFYAESFGASATVVTLIGAAYSLMQFLFAPFWGRLSDRIGRRPVILTSVFFGGIGWLILGNATGLWMFVLARAVAGFGNANLGTVQAVVADVTTGKDRARGMGMVGAAFGLGFLFGPIIGGIFGSIYGAHVPALIAAGLAAVNWVAAFFLLPESRRPDAVSSTVVVADAHGPRRSVFPIAALREVASISGVAPLLWMSLVFGVGFSLMESALSLFVERQFVPVELFGSEEGHKLAARYAMFVLVSVGVTAVIVQGGLIRPLRKKFSERKLLSVGSLLIAFGFAGTAGLGLLPVGSIHLGVLIALNVFVAAGSGVFSPSQSALLSRSAEDAHQGAVLGVGQSVASLSRIIGPGVAGLLLDTHRALPFVLAAVLMVVAAGLTTRVRDTA